MPSKVIVCGADGVCTGTLSMIAHTIPHTGMQYGDSTDVCYFFLCSSLDDDVWHVNAGMDENHINPADMRLYTGNLTVDEIKKLIPLKRGHFYPRADDRSELSYLVDHLAPEKGVFIERTVQRDGDKGIVHLPKGWVGKTVVVTVQ